VGGLVTTAGAIVLLIGLIMVIQFVAQRQARQRRAGRGRGPAGSARRKTKHTKLKTSDAAAGPVSGKQEEEDDDDDDDDDEILGDDDDTEAPRRLTTGKAVPVENAPSEKNGEASKVDAEKATDKTNADADDDEAALMRRVHSLLDDLPLVKGVLPTAADGLPPAAEGVQPAAQAPQ